MKNILKKYILILTLLSFVMFANAQKGDFAIAPTIGVTTPILDGGIGFHIGVNPSYSILPSFSIESQLSYLYTKISSSFISGKTGMSNSVNILLGGRQYLNSNEKTTRFYLNLLVGGNYNKQKLNGESYEGEFNFGISAGGFFEFNKFLIGLSYETPQNFILKMGYVFK